MDRRDVIVLQRTTPQWLLVIAVMLGLGILTLTPPIFAAKTIRIDSINPSCASVGDKVTITGQEFGAKNVKITVGGMAAQVLAATGSKVTFTTPVVLPGLTTVTATNPRGQTGSIAFR